LITIPFWWDKSLKSLAATIQAHRLDVIPQVTSGYAISKDLPKEYKHAFKYRPNTAQNIPEDFNPTNWYFITTGSSNYYKVDDGNV
jgi:hypothetical protein